MDDLDGPRTLAAMAVLPLVLYKVISPEVRATPEAPRAAREALAALGPLRAHEKIVAATFSGMVILWASASMLHVDMTAVAVLGLGIVLVTGVLTPDDFAEQGDVLATFIWFAVLFTLSSQLNELGFMSYVGGRLAEALGGVSPAVATGLSAIRCASGASTRAARRPAGDPCRRGRRPRCTRRS